MYHEFKKHRMNILEYKNQWYRPQKSLNSASLVGGVGRFGLAWRHVIKVHEVFFREITHHLSSFMTFSGLELLDSAFNRKATSYCFKVHSNCPGLPSAKKVFVFIWEAILRQRTNEQTHKPRTSKDRRALVSLLLLLRWVVCAAPSADCMQQPPLTRERR